MALLTEQARGGVRRRDRLPRYSVPPQWQATTHNPENIRRHLRCPPRRSADFQQRAALRERVTGRGPVVWSAPSPRVTLEVHFSSPPVAVHKSSYRHCGAVFPRYCAPQEDQSGSAADWRPPKSGDQEDDDRLPSDKGNRPRDRAAWTMVLRHGHVRSARVVVLVYARSENHPRSLQHCCAESLN